MLMYIHIFKYVPIFLLIGVFIVPASTYLTLDRNEINYDSINQKVRGFGYRNRSIECQQTTNNTRL